jgi:putative ABC transport system permease protein
MNSVDITAMAFKNLWRRKVRTVLTVLGVIVGTASIVMMLSIGIGMNESFKKQVSMMGSLNLITVNNYYYPEIEGGGYVQPQQTTLDDEALKKIAQIKGVEAATPLLYTYLKFVSGKYVAYGQVVGIYVETMEAFDFKLSQGRLLTPEDTDSLVFGSGVVNNFYDPNSRGNYWYYNYENQEEPVIDVMNDKIVMTFDMSYGERRQSGGGQPRDARKRPVEIKVVGLLEEGQSEKDYSTYINIDYLKKLMQANSQSNKMPGRISYAYPSNTTDGYEQAWVKVTKLEDVERVQETIKQMGYGAYSLTDMLRQMLDATKNIRMVLGVIGVVAFFIAAIGITNTMIMSIYERTKEIGIMKVLGCMLKDIRKLFLLESALIGLLGSILGVAFSYGVSLLLNRAEISFLDIGWYMSGEKAQISVIPIWLNLAAIGFGSVVGIFSGVYPAARAMRISALEAIRNE